MSEVLVLAPAARDDETVRLTSWIADKTARRLVRSGALVGRAVGDDVDRRTLERALQDDIAGLAFFGHGSPRAVHGADGEPILDRDNVGLLADRWAHLFACRAGVELTGLAAAAGATCCAGYESSLIAELDPRSLPEPLRDLFADLVASTTELLAAGCYDKRTLRQAADRAAGALALWCMDHPDVNVAGLEPLAQQLVERLVVRCG